MKFYFDELLSTLRCPFKEGPIAPLRHGSAQMFSTRRCRGVTAGCVHPRGGGQRKRAATGCVVTTVGPNYRHKPYMAEPSPDVMPGQDQITKNEYQKQYLLQVVGGR